MRDPFTFDRRMWLAAGAIALCLTGCYAPADPDGTTDRIRATHELRAGASENRPWIRFEDGKALGPEAELLERFAASLGAHVRWVRGAESPLLKLLKQRQLDVVAGGITTATPWASDLGMSRPYADSGLFQEGHVLMTSPGENELLLRLDMFIAGKDRDGN